VKKFTYDKGNFDGIRKELSDASWYGLLTEKSTEEQWFIINKKLHVRSISVGGKGTKHCRPKWINDRIMSKINKNRDLYNVYRSTRLGKDYTAYT